MTFAIFNMIPFPPLNGHQLFYASRYLYVFCAGAIVACAGVLFFLPIAGTIISALIFGAVMATMYFVHIDKNW